jgi:hypothetical protein
MDPNFQRKLQNELLQLQKNNSAYVQSLDLTERWHLGEASLPLGLMGHHQRLGVASSSVGSFFRSPICDAQNLPKEIFDFLPKPR